MIGSRKATYGCVWNDAEIRKNESVAFGCRVGTTCGRSPRRWQEDASEVEM
jgi:hypothetical protein